MPNKIFFLFLILTNPFFNVWTLVHANRVVRRTEPDCPQVTEAASTTTCSILPEQRNIPRTHCYTSLARREQASRFGRTSHRLQNSSVYRCAGSIATLVVCCDLDTVRGHTVHSKGSMDPNALDSRATVSRRGRRILHMYMISA